MDMMNEFEFQGRVRNGPAFFDSKLHIMSSRHIYLDALINKSRCWQVLWNILDALVLTNCDI